MAIASDFEIQNDKDIRYIGSTANYTVLELHQWLRDLADDAVAVGDDFMDISRPTPSERAYDTIITLINGYNIDDTAAQHLYGGSIIQSGGDVIYDGIQVLAPAGMYLDILQNGALATNFWTTGLNAVAASGISHQFILKVRTAGADIDGRRIIGLTREWGKTFLEFKATTARGVTVLAFPSWADDLNNDTAEGTVDTWDTITNITAGYNGIDVNNDTVDEYYYSEWNKASYTIPQLYERMKYLARRGETITLYGLQGQIFRGITNELAGTQSSGTFVTPESCTWATGSGQILAVDSTTAATKVWIQLLTGTPPTTGNVTANGGAVFAVSGNTDRSVSTPFCGQCTGTAIIGAYGFGIEALDLATTDSVTALDNNPYSPPNYQLFTLGGLVDGEDYGLVGPRGYRFFYDQEASGPFTVGETLTFTSPAGTAVLADLLDLGTTGEMYIGPMLTGSAPQDNSTIAGATATAVVNGAVKDDINLRQMTLNGALTGGSVTSVVVNEAIPPGTPASGTIRIKRVSGRYSRHPYSAVNAGTKTFTITSHDFSSDNAPNGGQVFISYIDALVSGANYLDYTAIYTADVALFIRVRDGGATPIKPFETTATYGAGGGSATAVRTSDA